MERGKLGWKIRELTTERGIYQHGSLDKADPKFGYALDDQARALMVADELGEKELAEIYLKFIRDACVGGKCHQFFYGDERGWEEGCSEDALGLVLWALLKCRREEVEIIEDIKRKVSGWKYTRSIAIALLGLKEKYLADELVDMFYKKSSSKWQWFEDELVYANAVIPWSLWKFGEIEVAKKTTNFLIKECQIDGVPAPIGCKGWYKRGGKKALYDQQPVDVAYMVCCLEQAFFKTKESFYLEEAKKWWGWFWGNNTRGVRVVDEKGACFDAITDKEDKVNLNQGAESNICYLMAWLAAERLGLLN